MDQSSAGQYSSMSAIVLQPNKVYKDLDDFGTLRVEEPEHAPTMRELMKHTAGFSYGFGASKLALFRKGAVYRYQPLHSK